MIFDSVARTLSTRLSTGSSTSAYSPVAYVCRPLTAWRVTCSNQSNVGTWIASSVELVRCGDTHTNVNRRNAFPSRSFSNTSQAIVLSFRQLLYQQLLTGVPCVLIHQCGLHARQRVLPSAS